MKPRDKTELTLLKTREIRWKASFALSFRPCDEKSCCRRYQLFDIQGNENDIQGPENEVEFDFVLTLSPRFYAFLDKRIFGGRLECN